MKKKNILKRLLTLTLVAALTLSTVPVLKANATTLDNPKNKIEDYNYMPDLDSLDSNFSVTEGDTVIYFANQEDLDLYKSMNSNRSNEEISPLYGEGQTVEILSSSYKNYLWIGYHSGTSSWTKSSSYTLTSDKTYSAEGSYEYQGFTVNLGFSYSNSVSSTIDADRTRFSRLGTWGDFKFNYCKYIETYYGVPTGRVSYGVSKTMYNHYVDPVYQ